jgi:NADPH:quinone reductase-like Zn-dependent oxidoreductase
MARASGQANHGLLLRPFVSQKIASLLADSGSTADMDRLRDLMQIGKLVPAIDRQYNLNETPEALRYLEKGHARGKVVINVE